jgi:hypothetical protein
MNHYYQRILHKLIHFTEITILSFSRGFQNLPKWTIFHFALEGYWYKFSHWSQPEQTTLVPRPKPTHSSSLNLFPNENTNYRYKKSELKESWAHTMRQQANAQTKLHGLQSDEEGPVQCTSSGYLWNTRNFTAWLSSIPYLCLYKKLSISKIITSNNRINVE